MYMVQFVRLDNQPDEEYYYTSLSDAMNHLNLFRDDNSKLYLRIGLSRVEGPLETVIEARCF